MSLPSRRVRMGGCASSQEASASHHRVSAASRSSFTSARAKASATPIGTMSGNAVRAASSVTVVEWRSDSARWRPTFACAGVNRVSNQPASRGDNSHTGITVRSRPRIFRIGEHNALVGCHVRPADLKDLRSSELASSGCDQIGYHVFDSDRLSRDAHPVGGGYHGQFLHKVPHHFVGRRSRANHNACAELNRLNA